MYGSYKNILLNEKQFSFRPNHSTNMAVIELAKAVERNEPTLGFFDLQDSDYKIINCGVPQGTILGSYITHITYK